MSPYGPKHLKYNLICYSQHLNLLENLKHHALKRHIWEEIELTSLFSPKISVHPLFALRMNYVIPSYYIAYDDVHCSPTPRLHVHSVIKLYL